ARGCLDRTGKGRYHSRFHMTVPEQPDVSLSLNWQGGQVFKGTSGGVSMTLDGTRETGPSPVQAMGFALAGCMAIDVVDVIGKGRLPVKAVSCDLRVFRAEETPRRITRLNLHFVVKGEVPEDRVARAIELSREKYCSVWHSLNPTIDFKTSFTVSS
ncbi:MAG: OsmC family protein, partial [Vicinamibacteria bacterium]